jgi:glycosyltransferase involved in cell wall biosynthesis
MKDGYVADFSLALINRTGAYHICRDLVQGLPEQFAHIRYWRLCRKREPNGIVRKILGKAMLAELGSLARSTRARRRFFHETRQQATLYFDPLYVLGHDLHWDDVVLCHDVGPLSHPELYDAGTVALYRCAYDQIRYARSGIVFVSYASMLEFVHFCGRDFRFLRVIPLYVRSNSGMGSDSQPKGVDGPFLLTVAALEIRKNLTRCIEAFVQSGLREQGYTYILCGPRGNASKEIAALAKATPGVELLGFLPDEELRWLYRNATGFVLPSLLEGFGLPALEAGAHGLVPLVSEASAQTEAVGDGAVTANPLSAESIAAGMMKLVTMSEAEREERLAHIRRQIDMLTLNRFLIRWGQLLTTRGEEAR